MHPVGIRPREAHQSLVGQLLDAQRQAQGDGLRRGHRYGCTVSELAAGLRKLATEGDA